MTMKKCLSVSNKMNWDGDKKQIWCYQPVILSYNKDTVYLKGSIAFSKQAKRNN